MSLNARQLAFVEAYSGNAAEAARAAGYSPKTADRIGSRLLRFVEVAAAIEARRAKASANIIATREERQRFWTEMMRDVVSDPKDRLKASELLGKSEADFTEKVEHGGAMNIAVVDPYAEKRGG